MLGHAGKAFSQIFHPSFRSAFFKALGITILLVVALWAAALAALGYVPEFELADWLDTAVQWVLGLGIVAASIIVTPYLIAPVAAAAIAFFLEDVASAVEIRHYPGAPMPRNQPFGEIIVTALRFLLAVIIVNLIALPFYILAFFVAGLGLFLYVLVNGYLVGREYFELVALRHMPRSEAQAMRKRHLGTVFLAGGITSALFLIPVVNLIAPLFGTALMVHVFWSLRHERV